MPAEKRAAGTMAWFAGRFLHWIPAADVRKKWAAGTTAWFAGRFLHWIPAADVRKKMGRRNPHPVWGFKNIKGSGVGWLRVALYAGLLCKRGVHGGTQKAQNGNLGQVELENGWPVGF